MVASETSLLNLALDLASRQQLSIFDDLVSTFLQFLAQGAQTLSWLSGVWVVHVLVGDVKLHPIDV